MAKNCKELVEGLGVQGRYVYQDLEGFKDANWNDARFESLKARGKTTGEINQLMQAEIGGYIQNNKDRLTANYILTNAVTDEILSSIRITKRSMDLQGKTMKAKDVEDTMRANFRKTENIAKGYSEDLKNAGTIEFNGEKINFQKILDDDEGDFVRGMLNDEFEGDGVKQVLAKQYMGKLEEIAKDVSKHGDANVTAKDIILSSSLVKSEILKNVDNINSKYTRGSLLTGRASVDSATSAKVRTEYAGKFEKVLEEFIPDAKVRAKATEDLVNFTGLGTGDRGLGFTSKRSGTLGRVSSIARLRNYYAESGLNDEAFSAIIDTVSPRGNKVLSSIQKDIPKRMGLAKSWGNNPNTTLDNIDAGLASGLAGKITSEEGKSIKSAMEKVRKGLDHYTGSNQGYERQGADSLVNNLLGLTKTFSYPLLGIMTLPDSIAGVTYTSSFMREGLGAKMMALKDTSTHAFDRDFKGFMERATSEDRVALGAFTSGALHDVTSSLSQEGFSDSAFSRGLLQATGDFSYNKLSFLPKAQELFERLALRGSHIQLDHMSKRSYADIMTGKNNYQKSVLNSNGITEGDWSLMQKAIGEGGKFKTQEEIRDSLSRAVNDEGVDFFKIDPDNIELEKIRRYVEGRYKSKMQYSFGKDGFMSKKGRERLFDDAIDYHRKVGNVRSGGKVQSLEVFRDDFVGNSAVKFDPTQDITFKYGSNTSLRDTVIRENFEANIRMAYTQGLEKFRKEGIIKDLQTIATNPESKIARKTVKKVNEYIEQKMKPDSEYFKRVKQNYLDRTVDKYNSVIGGMMEDIQISEQTPLQRAVSTSEVHQAQGLNFALKKMFAHFKGSGTASLFNHFDKRRFYEFGKGKDNDYAGAVTDLGIMFGVATMAGLFANTISKTSKDAMLGTDEMQEYMEMNPMEFAGHSVASGLYLSTGTYVPKPLKVIGGTVRGMGQMATGDIEGGGATLGRTGTTLMTNAVTRPMVDLLIEGM